MRKLAGLGLLVAVTAVLLIGCGSSPSSNSNSGEEAFAGQWESTGGEKLSLQVDAPAEGAYPVTFAGGDIETKMSATRVNDGEYQAKPKFVWTFRMVDDGLMNVEIDSGDGESATTTFKRIGD